MKEYEKLALKEASYQCTTGNEHFDEARSGYIAYGFEQGFLKARELLRAMETSQTRSWFEIPMKDLEELGEKEV